MGTAEDDSFIRSNTSLLSFFPSPYFAHLSSVTLNYCAALGLMEVGVLKKPGMFEYERMKRPVGPDSNPAAVQQDVGNDGVIDMSKLDSDDDGD